MTKVNKKKIQGCVLIAATLLLSTACNMLRRVPQDAFLLNKVSIETTDSEAVQADELRSYVRQKPNKRILGFRFYLWLYNKADPDKDNAWNNWLRNNGEAPVLLDETLAAHTREQFALYLEQKGYYHAGISYQVQQHRRRKADVVYRVAPAWPHRICRVAYDIDDAAVRGYVMADTVRSLLRTGMPFDSDVLQAERERLKLLLLDRGYFGFSEHDITFEADTFTLPRQVGLTVRIRPAASSGTAQPAAFPTYTVRNVTVRADLDVDQLSGRAAPGGRQAPDTVRLDGYQFLMHPDFPVKPSVIAQSIHLHPDSLYRVGKADMTYRRLMNLQTFKLVNVQFQPAADASDHRLDMQVDLLPFKMQHYGVEVEGTNTGGNMGGAVNLVYQHKSLFHRAETFDLKLLSMLEAIHQEGIDFNYTQEYGVETRLSLPKLLLPFFNLKRFEQQYDPHTVISAQYNYQLRSDYERTIANVTLSYTWRSGRTLSHTVRPVDVNFVRLPYLSDRFLNQISGTYLEHSYQNHMVLAGGYTLLRSTQQSSASQRHFSYLRASVESAGLLARTISQLAGRDGGTPYTLLGNAFSQFFKVDFDYRFYQRINQTSQMVYRIMAGVGVPYGNSESIPFERKYYAGGANSIRGWKARTLGPGSYRDTRELLYPNSTGDVKLEANLEYRFKLFWMLEGALFCDLGNVWDIRRDDMRPGAEFKADRFTKELALSAGPGLRLDASFFILRTDLGFMLRDPAEADPWHPVKYWHGLHDAALSIGIGYPF